MDVETFSFRSVLGVVSSSESKRLSEEESCDTRPPKSEPEFGFEETVNSGTTKQWSTPSLDETFLVMVGSTSESSTETRVEEMFDSAALNRLSAVEYNFSFSLSDKRCLFFLKLHYK
jgi:hypothetical protein